MTFKLETDHAVLESKARAALAKYDVCFSFKFGLLNCQFASLNLYFVHRCNCVSVCVCVCVCVCLSATKEELYVHC